MDNEQINIREVNEEANVLNLPMPSAMVNTIHYVCGKVSTQYVRDGIPLDKGSVEANFLCIPLIGRALPPCLVGQIRDLL